PGQGQLFVDWFKYMLIEYPGTGPPVTNPSSDDAYDYLGLEVATVNDAIAAAAALDKAIAQASADLVALLGQNWVLSSVASPRFWQPTAPVVLLAGPDAARVDRYGRNGQQGFPFTLPARLADTVVSSIGVPSLGATVEAADLPGLDLSATPYAPELAALVA